MDWNTLSQLSCAFLCLLLQLFVLLRNYRSKFSSAKKNPPLKCCPEYNQQLFLLWSSRSQWGCPRSRSAMCSCWERLEAVLALQWEEPSLCCGARAGGQAVPTPVWHWQRSQSWHKGVSTCSCNVFVLFLHRCLNGWDRSIWRKNRLG